ncbi:DUF6303 family protein [Streptomyces sp. NPDC059708]|uniref:DUF6303 family protein n=1 Tax=Streptomyces sp. NPDC059708 TaxID=3346916 RepID=UPI0036B41DAF
MTDTTTAYLTQNTFGDWHLWVWGPDYGDHPGVSLNATAPGRVPSAADRVAALARLDFSPADPDNPAGGWQWREIRAGDGGLMLVGELVVVPVGENQKPTVTI